MLEFDDNTGEKDELDPVLDDETFQDEDEDFEDSSGQTDETDEDEEDNDNSNNEEGNDTDNGDSTETTSEKTNSKGKTPTEDTDSPSSKKPLSKEENAANAARRRQEALESKVKEEHVKTVIDVLGGVNPYTKKEMTDAHDVDVYERMRRIEKAGGDPVADYASTLAEEKRQAEKAVKEDKNTDFNAWAKKDGQEFAKANPDVDINELFKDENFNLIAEPLLQRRVPMSEIYKIFQKTQSNINSVKQKAKQKLKDEIAGGIANNNASTGSLKSNGDTSDGLYTMEQLKALTPAQIEANLDKVERSYEKIYAKK